jgi:hypothetical protein
MLLAVALLFTTGAGHASQQGVSSDAPAAGEVVRIDQPGVLDQPGATYLLTRDVTAPRTAFMIKGDGITLDLGGHTVTYGTEVGVDYCHGVFLRPGGGEEPFKGVPKEGFGGGNNFTVRNGRIVQGKQPVAPEGAITYRSGRIVSEEGDHRRPGRCCHAVYIRGSSGFLVDGVTTEVNSRDSNNVHVLYCKSGEIAGNHCISTVREITNRHWPGTQVIHVSPVGGYVNVHHNTIDGGGQWGIYVASQGSTGHLAEVHHNVIRHRSHTTNGYAIGCHAPNMRVYANVVKSIGRGVHLTANNVDLYNNVIEPREKPNPEYPSTRTHGIKLEGPSRSQVHHNFCRVVAEEGFGDADPLDLDCPRYSANRVYRNTVEAIRAGDNYWAASINVIRAEPSNLAVVHDNVFRTNHWHLRGDWGGMRGVLFADNRFEIIGEPEDYEFFALKQSTAATTNDMVFRDNKLVSPADYRKAHLLYAKRYTRANVDLAVQWTVHVAAVDPAGKPVGAVSAIARDEKGEAVAQAITDGEGKAELVLTDYHLIGNRGNDPFQQQGPYELTFLYDDREVKKQKVDPTETMNVRITVTEPERTLYVYAGENQRLTTGDVAKLDGKVVVVGDESAMPEIRWTVVEGVGGPKVATPDALQSNLAFENPTESWLQQAELELAAKWGDQTASDRVTIREDANVTPKAVITGPKKAKAGTIVQLDASRSTEPRRFPSEVIRYQWRQTGGPTADLSSTEWISPIFFPEQPGVYTFELTVSSPIATSEPASFAVEVTGSHLHRELPGR